MKGKKRAKSTDFPSKKRKLGKSKRPAENATRVSFKSKSIVVPSQLEQTQQPTGRRKLSLEVSKFVNNSGLYVYTMRPGCLEGLYEKAFTQFGRVRGTLVEVSPVGISIML